MFLPPYRTPRQRFSAWFKQFQKRWNDWLLTPLAIFLFLQVPAWANKLLHGEEFHGFSADTLMALPTALVMFCFASLGAYGMFRVQHPDLFDEFTRCNEEDLLKKVVSSDALELLDHAKYLTPLASRHAWRIYSASQSILSSYFWALVLLQAAIAATVPTQP